MDFSTFVIAAASIVTAVATAVLAWLGRGTWKLYSLERENHVARRTLVAAKARRMAAELRRNKKSLEKLGDPLEDLQLSTVLTLRDEMLLARDQLDRMFVDAVGLGPTVLALLDLARAEVISAHRHALLIENTHKAGFAEYVLSDLNQAINALEVAYDSIPVEYRPFGETDYAKVLGDIKALAHQHWGVKTDDSGATGESS